ncbi:MAG: GNAT family N-acetyltransferase [Acidobacteria bacterium]|nr:GNAT family N-acetyltransferase [Acidobacteriota bacterium]MBV9478546.1 GNAT family N-acetyltransferase [Acidobacteriota bacterium]
MNIAIRRAVGSDAPRATELARLAKAHWGYPADWLAAWRDDLSLSPDDIERHETFVAELNGEVVGVCQLQQAGGPSMLEHVWVDPRCHGQGVGRALVTHAQGRASGPIAIVADPNAERFYLKLGARRVGDVAAPMPGAPRRSLPLLELDGAG